jgi:hypothetical protein
VITLRCTRKLFLHLDQKPEVDEHEPTAALGDWYANLIFVTHGPPLILFTNERTLLSVVLPHTALGDLEPQFRRRVIGLLNRLSLSADGVANEVSQLQPIRYGKTKSRRVLGTMNDVSNAINSMLEYPGAPKTTDAIEMALTKTPYSMIDYRAPVDVAQELLGSQEA